MSELLSIGRFSRLCGLSIGALRHYHEEGVLQPARIDPDTGYRSYDPTQLDEARLLGRLRELGLSLPEIRAFLEADPVARSRRLAAHRARLLALLARTQRQVHWLNRTIDHEEPIMSATHAAHPHATLDTTAERALAAGLFNHVWTLLETERRTPEQDDEMLHAAHASRHHWGVVGEAVHRARGEWQCSRVYAALGRPEPALWHARRSLALAEAHGLGPFDVAVAHEAIARAHRVAGDSAASDEAAARARAVAATIDDAEERDLVLADLATI
ncbi:MAG TPA: MerR family transcriptional regulator [Candidatus Angelobacter sp.]|nr:MerR family transcriptional regulator [Candidatus Angelobacter sp.]